MTSILFLEHWLMFCFQNVVKKTQVTEDCSTIEITQKTKLQTIKPHSLHYCYLSADFLDEDIHV